MQELLLRCNETSDIYFYGAGVFANLTYYLFRRNGLEKKIKGFLVSDYLDEGNTKFGLPLRCYKEIDFRKTDYLIIVATQETVQKEIVKNLQSDNLLNYLCINCENVINQFYDPFFNCPVDRNKILFLNMKGSGYGGNPKYISQKLIDLDQDSKLDLVWAVSDSRCTFPKQIRTVEFGSEKYYYELATAGVWIDNSRKTSEIKKRDGQYYVQTWHGAAPIKKVEKDVEDKLSATYINNAIHDSKLADIFISGSEFYSNLYKKSFWYDGEIMQVGLPRQDIFFCKEGIEKKIRDFFCVGNDCLIVLYAPTFRRDKGNRYYNINLEQISRALQSRFKKRFVAFVSKHPDIRQVMYDHIVGDYIDVGEYDDFEELLVAADVLISDYSGCVYDYSFSKKPVFLYQPDYDEYINDRNFYYSMEELPYIQAFSNDELVNKIQQFDEKEYLINLERFMEKMGNYDDGKASEKVARRIMSWIDET